jgi:hypothetical protein
MAPEVLKSAEYSLAADVYSFAIGKKKISAVFT